MATLKPGNFNSLKPSLTIKQIIENIYVETYHGCFDVFSSPQIKNERKLHTDTNRFQPVVPASFRFTRHRPWDAVAEEAHVWGETTIWHSCSAVCKGSICIFYYKFWTQRTLSCEHMKVGWFRLVCFSPFSKLEQMLKTFALKMTVIRGGGGACWMRKLDVYLWTNSVFLDLLYTRMNWLFVGYFGNVCAAAESSVFFPLLPLLLWSWCQWLVFEFFGWKSVVTDV